MPQLDPLIFISLSLETTFFFWVFYFVNVRLILSNLNYLMSLKISLKAKYFLSFLNNLNNIYSLNTVLLSKFLFLNLLFRKKLKLCMYMLNNKNFFYINNFFIYFFKNVNMSLINRLNKLIFIHSYQVFYSKFKF